MNEEQLKGNLTSIEHELLYLILKELRVLNEVLNAPQTEIKHKVDTTEPTKKTTAEIDDFQEPKPPKKRGTPRKKKTTK